MSIEIRQLGPGDADALFGLRRHALLEEPFAFLFSPEDDSASSPAAVCDQLSSASDGTIVLGVFDGDYLIGMVGLTRDRPIKAAHRACIWGVFVRSEYRRMAVGARLLEVTLDHARRLDSVRSVYLSVSERTPDAKPLYESVGFVVWGVEPDCIRYAGESAREYHLSLPL